MRLRGQVVMVSGGGGHEWLWGLAQAWWLLAALLVLVQMARCHWARPVAKAEAKRRGKRRGKGGKVMVRVSADELEPISCADDASEAQASEEE